MLTLKILLGILVLILLYVGFIFGLGKYVDSQIVNANYCSADEECVQVSVCSRPCGSELVNMNEVDRIRGLIRIQAKQPFGIACSSAKCKPTFLPPLACVENKCVEGSRTK